MEAQAYQLNCGQPVVVRSTVVGAYRRQGCEEPDLPHHTTEVFINKLNYLKKKNNY